MPVPPFAFRVLLGLCLAGVLLAGCEAPPAPRSLDTTDPGPLTHETPLRPAQILEGRPRTYTTDVYRSDDGHFFVAYWSASAGRFTWDYTGINEAVTILEGEAFVTTGDGITHHLQPGVTMTFGVGDRAEWRVPKYVRKVAVVQKVSPSWWQRLRAKVSSSGTATPS